VNEVGGVAKKASMRDVRRTNRALVVRHLLLAGESSRSSAGEATALSAATVTNVITELIEEGTVQEQGFLDSDGGRRRAILGLNPAAALVFGADVGESRITVEAFDLTLRRQGRRTHDFSGRSISPLEVRAFLVQATAELLDDLQVERAKVLGLGLGVPGVVEDPADPKGESIIHAQVIGWESVTLAGLDAELGFPVLIDNGAKTTTQAEAWYGSARDEEHAIVVLIGDGAGAGIITNGRLYRGSSSSAGEWGHTKISLDGPSCRCGSEGCVEMFVGAAAVLANWRKGDRRWVGREAEGVDSLLIAASSGDDPDAERALSDLRRHLGLALSNLVNLYNPRKIIIGGWFGDRIAAQFLDDIGSEMRRFSLKQPGNEAVLERSALGQDAVALGAATLPLDRFIETGWSH
jgi:predicted NBD/HSP70 family sugar kinase